MADELAVDAAMREAEAFHQQLRPLIARGREDDAEAPLRAANA